MGAKKRGFALFAVALILATVASAEEVNREGVIVTRSNNNLNVRTREGALTVVVTPETTIRETSGLLQRRTRGPETLIPGLILKVEGDLLTICLHGTPNDQPPPEFASPPNTQITLLQLTRIKK